MLCGVRRTEKHGMHCLQETRLRGQGSRMLKMEGRRCLDGLKKME